MMIILMPVLMIPVIVWTMFTSFFFIVCLSGPEVLIWEIKRDLAEPRSDRSLALAARRQPDVALSSHLSHFSIILCHFFYHFVSFLLVSVRIITTIDIIIHIMITCLFMKMVRLNGKPSQRRDVNQNSSEHCHH